jgi:hypothetical protein
MLLNQPPSQVAILMLTGVAMSAVNGALLTNFRGFLDGYSRNLFRTYQKSWYRTLFIWTRRQRDLASDVSKVRKNVRVVAVFGLAMGAFIIAVELAALATGRVT